MGHFNYKNLFNHEIRKLFSKSLFLSIKNRYSFVFFIRFLKTLSSDSGVRAKYWNRGIEVPPLIIFSITGKCNLNCKGCYALEKKKNEPDLSTDEFRSILLQAKKIGVSICLLAGGEPLLKKEFISILPEFNNIFFPIFTNGTLIDSQNISFFRKNRHCFPVLSIEGDVSYTDSRRGTGLFEKITHLCALLSQNKLLYGISITLTSKNYDHVLSFDFINSIILPECFAFVFVEYVPLKSGTEDLCLTDGQKEVLEDKLNKFRKQYPCLFISLPGDEEKYGGCLAGGRGFLHITNSGSIEPCPFAPFSDINLKNTDLLDALQSKFLSRIRENHSLLTEKKGGCALWENRDFVQKLLNKEE